MRNGYQIHNETSAPQASRPLLESIQEANGFVPNCLGALANSPVALQGYLALDQQIGQSSFSPQEQNVIYLAVARENACPYCVAAHSAFAKMAGLSEPTVQRLRTGVDLEDTRLQALHEFTSRLVRCQGNVDEADVQTMLEAGYRREQILEIILFVAIKTIGAYANRLMGTDLDEMLKPDAWSEVA